MPKAYCLENVSVRQSFCSVSGFTGATIGWDTSESDARDAKWLRTQWCQRGSGVPRTVVYSSKEYLYSPAMVCLYLYLEHLPLEQLLLHGVGI